MRGIIAYCIIFALPLVIYLLWLKFLAARLGILFLLPLIICAVWLTLWPVNWLPAYEAAIRKPVDSRADAIVNGFLLNGWLYGVIGCIPVILIDALRGFLCWRAKRRPAVVAKNHTLPSPPRITDEE